MLSCTYLYGSNTIYHCILQQLLVKYVTRHTLSLCHTKLVVRTKHVLGGGGPPRFDSTIRFEILTVSDLTSTYVLSEWESREDEDVLFSVADNRKTSTLLQSSFVVHNRSGATEAHWTAFPKLSWKTSSTLRTESLILHINKENEQHAGRGEGRTQ